MEEKKILEIITNWYHTHEGGEEYDKHAVGEDGVTKIEEHSAQGEGDKWYYDVHYDNGEMLRLFNVNQVSYGIV